MLGWCLPRCLPRILPNETTRRGARSPHASLRGGERPYLPRNRELRRDLGRRVALRCGFYNRAATHLDSDRGEFETLVQRNEPPPRALQSGGRKGIQCVSGGSLQQAPWQWCSASAVRSPITYRRSTPQPSRSGSSLPTTAHRRSRSHLSRERSSTIGRSDRCAGSLLLGFPGKKEPQRHTERIEVSPARSRSESGSPPRQTFLSRSGDDRKRCSDAQHARRPRAPRTRMSAPKRSASPSTRPPPTSSPRRSRSTSASGRALSASTISIPRPRMSIGKSLSAD